MPKASANRIPPPTLQQFKAYQAAYDYFNRKLFAGQLAPCLLVFRDGRAPKGFVVAGHFARHRWENADGELVHEISLAPLVLKREFVEVMGTLVHEMCHQWQQDHGTPPSSRRLSDRLHTQQMRRASACSARGRNKGEKRWH